MRMLCEADASTERFTQEGGRVVRRLWLLYEVDEGCFQYALPWGLQDLKKSASKNLTVRPACERRTLVLGLKRSPGIMLCARRLLAGKGTGLFWLVTAIDFRRFGEVFLVSVIVLVVGL